VVQWQPDFGNLGVVAESRRHTAGMGLGMENKTAVEADIAHGVHMVVEQTFVLAGGWAGNSLDGNGRLTKSGVKVPLWVPV
jgi:hypothetical protein